jgi:hypothetical protein
MIFDFLNKDLSRTRHSLEGYRTKGVDERSLVIKSTLCGYPSAQLMFSKYFNKSLSIQHSPRFKTKIGSTVINIYSFSIWVPYKAMEERPAGTSEHLLQSSDAYKFLPGATLCLHKQCDEYQLVRFLIMKKNLYCSCCLFPWKQQHNNVMEGGRTNNGIVAVTWIYVFVFF